MSIVNILLQLMNQFPIIFVIILLKILGILSFAHIIAIYISYCIYVQITSKRQNVVISAPEEIAYKYKWISKKKLLEAAESYGKSPYGDHLKEVARDVF